jgi:hypothetical protein
MEVIPSGASMSLDVKMPIFIGGAGDTDVAPPAADGKPITEQPKKKKKAKKTKKTEVAVVLRKLFCKP